MFRCYVHNYLSSRTIFSSCLTKAKRHDGARRMRKRSMGHVMLAQANLYAGFVLTQSCTQPFWCFCRLGPHFQKNPRKQPHRVTKCHIVYLLYHYYYYTVVHGWGTGGTRPPTFHRGGDSIGIVPPLFSSEKLRCI